MAEGWKGYGIVKVPGLPAPTGAYAVGTVDLMHQGLLVRIFYPTNAGNYEYANNNFRQNYTYLKAAMSVHDVPLSGLLAGALNFLTSPRMPAYSNVPLLQPGSIPQSEQEQEATGDSLPTVPSQFPVLVFSHGLSSFFFANNAICCDFASHGYVVASLEHKDGSSCIALRRVPGRGVEEGQYDRYIDQWIPFDKTISMADPSFHEREFSLRNRQVKIRSAEVGQVFDLFKELTDGADVRNMLGGNYDFSQFKGRLDLDRAAVIGHSFGGATTVQTLSTDQRFRCGLALDSWLFALDEEVLSGGITQPLTFINSDSYQWPKNVARMMRLLNHEKGTKTCSMYTLKGSTHVSQSDTAFLAIPGTLKKLTDPPLDKYICHQVNIDLCHAFLKRFLLLDGEYQGNVPILDGGEGASEHVIYGTNIDWKSEVLASEEPTNELPTSEESTDEVPATSDEPTKELLAIEEPANEVAACEEPTSEVPASEESTNEVAASEEPTNEVPANHSEEPTCINDIPASEEPTNAANGVLTGEDIVNENQ